jgi:hypothetical protein
MAKFYRILGTIIYIIAGLYGLYSSWYYLCVYLGWDLLLFLVLSPPAAALVPFVLAFQGAFKPILVVYGGGIIGAFLTSTANRLENKPHDSDV